MAIIYPSLISADILNLQKQIEQLDPHCQGYHLDVMDYNFVPNLTWGPMFIDAIARITYKQLWVHLMINKDVNFIDAVTLPPKSIISFHFESGVEIKNIISRITEKEWLPSIAISPKTDVEKIFPFLNGVHQVLVMSVEPGFSGQQFLPDVMNKVDKLVGYRSSSNLDFKIGIDGGINEDNLAIVVEKGVDHIAIASGIFSHNDPVAQLQKLQKIAQ